MVPLQRFFFPILAMSFLIASFSEVSAQIVFTGKILDLRSEKAFGEPGQKWSYRPGDSPILVSKVDTNDPGGDDPDYDSIKPILFANAERTLAPELKNGWISEFPIQTSWDKVKDHDGEYYFLNYKEYIQKYNGYGWYRTEVSISNEDLKKRFKSRYLTLRLGQIGQADAVYWNGKFIGSTGLYLDTPPNEILDDKALFAEKTRFYRIPVGLINTAEPNVLAVRVFAKYPLSPGLSHDKFYISSQRYAERAEYWNDFKKIFVIVLTLLLGSFYLYWQFLFRKDEHATIFFSLGSIFMAINTMFQSQIIYSVWNDGFWIKKIEYASWIALVHFLFNFVIQFAKVDKGWIQKANLIVNGMGVFAFFGIFLAPDLFILSKLFFYWSFVAIVIGLSLCYIIFLGRKIPAMGTVSFGILIMIFLLMNDAIVELQWEFYPGETYLKDYAFAGFSISVGLSIISNMVASRKMVEKQKAEKDRLSRYFSPEVMKSIVNDSIKLGGEERDIATLFSDIVGFTTFSENNPPGVVLTHLNTIFEALSELIFEYSATLDKFIGDAIMAFWGAPKQTELDAYKAIACAVEMQKKMVQINKDLGLAPETFRLRIGVNFGVAIVGNIGSVRRMDYTVIGDAVNTAARLESHGTPGKVVVSEAAFLAAGGEQYIKYEDSKELMLKGKAEPVKVYFVTEVLPR